MQCFDTPSAQPPQARHAAPSEIGVNYHRIVDADAQARSLRGWDQSYDQLSPGPYSGTTLDIKLGNMQVFREVSSKALRQQGRAPSGTQVFALAVGGDARFRGSLLTQDALLNIEEGTEFEMCTPPGFTSYGLTVQVDALRGYADGLGNGLLDEHPGRRDVIRADAGDIGRLRLFLRSAFDGLQENPEVLMHEGARRNLSADILDQVFGVLKSALPALTDQRTARRHARIVSRAEGYVLTHAFESVTVADLCKHAGASRRQLQYAFQDVIGMSPNRYLRAIRLCRVRRELKAGLATGAGSIQDTAARWGFWHMGHFALDYKRMFAERPSDTLRGAKSVKPA